MLRHASLPCTLHMMMLRLTRLIALPRQWIASKSWAAALWTCRSSSRYVHALQLHDHCCMTKPHWLYPFGHTRELRGQ